MKTLIVITGATASGKTTLAIDVARALETEIISADSRQVYRDIPIGTAQPTAEELSAVAHHFIGFLPLEAYYSAARYEEDALKLLEDLFRKRDYVVMAGGSMMYVDAVTQGIDELPTISDEVRCSVVEKYESEGLEAVAEELRVLDPDYYSLVDLSNHRRVIHAVEICREAGVAYSTLRSGTVKDRPFKVVRFAIDRPREELFERINRRVEAMIEGGLEDEARRVYPRRHLNSLNTVGYKEMFAMFDGVMDRETAIARIAKNTRVYAKKQLAWMRRPGAPETVMLDPKVPLLEQILSSELL